MCVRPASPTPAGLGMPPRVHRLSDSGSDYLLASVGSCMCQADRPRGGWPASLWPILASSFAETLLCLCLLQGSGLPKYI